MGQFVRRSEIVDVIVSWLHTVPSDSDIFERVGRFATNHRLIADHQRRILEAIRARTFKQLGPPARGPAVEPLDLDELTIALTHIESDLYRPVSWIDYLSYARGLSSRLDVLLSTHAKMTRWVKYSVLKHDDIQDRADAMKRFAEAAEGCRRRQNYNSMAAIVAALDWKVKPMSDLPRTMAVDMDYKAYRKITQKKTNAETCIPWFTAQLDDTTKYLSQYPRTVGDLINFERYQRLALKLPMNSAQTTVEGHRQERHIAYLRHQFENDVYDDEAEAQRRRKLKRKEEYEVFSLRGKSVMKGVRIITYQSMPQEWERHDLN
ncbi:ras guanine nucleotide exchange factor domain-containing protein [Mycena vulgaris]|nr:ras guanine nucleotide exchange factor domain-containing protein [Mycena vulgaris]